MLTSTGDLVLDLFAGCGGWSEGLRTLGFGGEVGIEWDRDACATRTAAGHRTIRADLGTYPPRGRPWGLIASPPCTDFSTAGKGAGRGGVSGRLVDVVPRWVEALRPRWVACEQVPPVEPIWWEHAMFYREQLGYRTWVGLLNAADYGVPQTRVRAFLLASLDFEPRPPAPTHARSPQAPLFGEPLERWVSMADALGLDDGFETRYQRGAGMIARHGARPARDCDLPSPTLTGSALGAGGGTKLGLFVRTGNNSHVTSRIGSKAGEGGCEVYDRSVDEPSPTVDTKFAFTLHTNRGQDAEGNRQTREACAPAPALTGKSGGQWVFDRPATTVLGDPRLGSPGHRDRAGGERQFTADGIRLTVEDALVLQSFRRDFPLRGTLTSQFRQIGNAVPVLLARRVLEQFL